MIRRGGELNRAALMKIVNLTHKPFCSVLEMGDSSVQNEYLIKCLGSMVWSDDMILLPESEIPSQ